MLTRLSIRDVVLIERLDLDFSAGLIALTGETGAGKSILLDALGLVLGARADKGLVRAGADKAVVTAAFDVGPDHPAFSRLEEAGADGAPDGTLILRRQLSDDGRSKAWINDAPASVGLLAAVGETLVEIHGQHDDRGLLNARAHRRLLDAFGEHDAERETCAAAWSAWRDAQGALEARRRELESAGADAEWLAHAVDELDRLEPKAGEEAALDAERKLMMGAENLAAELQSAQALMAGERRGVEDVLAAALRGLETALGKTPAGDQPALRNARAAAEALERALHDTAEGVRLLDEAAADLDFDPARAEAVEERLFALRDVARKHRTTCDGLDDFRRRLRARLDGLDAGEADLRGLEDAAVAAEGAYDAAADALSDVRLVAARALDAAVAGELAPLKLDKARFETQVRSGEGPAGPAGRDTVEFTIATNPGANPGPLIKIASGGELARFILALKVCLARTGPARTLVFDEVDRGVGGAVAAAVGRRLSRLAQGAQVLVVTHSPQVAARADRQLRIAKSGAESTVTTVELLDEAGRLEEVARMLAGDAVTDAARAAARALIDEPAA